jgi:hypothetical protein
MREVGQYDACLVMLLFDWYGVMQSWLTLTPNLPQKHVLRIIPGNKSHKLEADHTDRYY